MWLLFSENFPLLMILTGVIGGVIVIIAIAMVIILCQRREKKPEGNNHLKHYKLLDVLEFEGVI